MVNADASGAGEAQNSDQVAKLVLALTKRAEWLRYEYLHGGNFEHLIAREAECLHAITLVDRAFSTGERT